MPWGCSQMTQATVRARVCAQAHVCTCVWARAHAWSVGYRTAVRVCEHGRPECVRERAHVPTSQRERAVQPPLLTSPQCRLPRWVSWSCPGPFTPSLPCARWDRLPGGTQSMG